MGSTKIINKINSLTIIIRSYTFGDINDNKVMLDQSKKRIFEFPKIEYTLRTIKSIIRSCELAKKSFKSKSHKRQSQIINLIHQRARAAYNNAKDPKVKIPSKSWQESWLG